MLRLPVLPGSQPRRRSVRSNMNKGFLGAGHPSTLFAAILPFDLSFTVWGLPGLARVKRCWRADWFAAASQRGAGLDAARA